MDANATGAIQVGSSIFPIHTVAGGLFVAAPGDIVLMRAGNYPENLTIDADAILRASKGDAMIGMLP